VLAARAEADPDAELVRFPPGRRLGVGQLTDGARSIAARLARLVPAGTRVATCLPPGPEAVEVIFGLALLGAVEVPLALDVTEPAAAALLAASGARLVITAAEVLAANPGLTAAAGGRTVLLTGGTPAPGHPLLAELAPGPLPARGPRPGDPLAIMSTSGTTGRSKGAVLPHFAALRHARRVRATMGYGPDDVLLNVFPWNHINVRHAALLPALLSGARLVARPRFSASGFWDTCRDEGVTAFNFMGAMLAILDRRPPGPDDTGHAVRLAYGGPAPRDLALRFRERFGVTPLEAYACTELGDVAASTTGTWRPGTAGRVVPEYDVAILDELGRALPPGETGQIAVRPRWRDITFAGYAGDPDATAAAWRDGWFGTGDRGVLDADGYLSFAGRRADVVRRRGENIATWDVEEAVRAMPGVVDVAALGVASELTEQELLVVLERAPGSRADGPAVHAWCRDKLPRHAVPRYVRVVNDLPRTPNGKVRKAALAEAGVDRFTWDAEAAPPGR
jgi:acyl-CoA synthetase (AMP-forming)/AMP-acid ligase II